MCPENWSQSQDFADVFWFLALFDKCVKQKKKMKLYNSTI